MMRLFHMNSRYPNVNEFEGKNYLRLMSEFLHDLHEVLSSPGKDIRIDSVNVSGEFLSETISILDCIFKVSS